MTTTPVAEATVWTHDPVPAVVFALTGISGTTVRIESKSVPIDMYAKDFFGRKKARLEIRKRVPKCRAQ
jgi:hypothetical protein